MDEGNISVERRGDQAHLFIAGVGAHNALDVATCRALAGHVDALGAEAGVRVIVLRGRGGDFCAGLDRRGLPEELERRDEVLLNRIRYGSHTIIEALSRCPTPTLAVIEGACLDFGFDLAMACDLRLAAVDATLGQPSRDLGLLPDGGSSFSLPRLVGLGRALELLLLGQPLDGATAAAWGLVNRALPAAELDAFAVAWAERLAAGPVVAQRLGKANLRESAVGGSLHDALEREATAQLACLRSADVRRAVGGER